MAERKIDEVQLNNCMEAYMNEGLSQEEARERCIKAQYVEEEVTASAADTDGRGRLGPTLEATNVERCAAMRMDIYGETEEEALKTCTRLLRDPFVKEVFEANDSTGIGVIFHNWDLHNLPEWKWWRDKQATEKSEKEKAVNKIIEEIQRDSSDPDHHLPDVSLKERAERIYQFRQDRQVRERMREDRAARLTVGSTHGKTKTEILTEQATSQETKYPERLADFKRCVLQRVSEGMTLEEAKAHCVAATRPSDEPLPPFKALDEDQKPRLTVGDLYGKKRERNSV